VTAPLRVLLTADPYLPVPPRLYGGIERIIDFLARGLVERGHRVTLVAHPESRTAGELVPFGRPPHVGARARAVELAQVAGAVLRRARDLDVVHSFGRLAALTPLLPLRAVAVVQSYQRAVPWRSVRMAALLGGRSLAFSGCSASMFAGEARPGDWHAIWNGVETRLYRATREVSPDAPLVFLGRLERIKGVHSAIAIARAARRKLVIAGNRVTDGGEPGYFEREVEPHLDGERVRWVGPVDDAAKNELLGGASALLMPIEWEEPFGIVMAEALACGTPVIGFRRGAVPEVVRDGDNGFVCATVEEAARAVSRLGAIDRARVRADCEARFDARVIVDAYEQLYRLVAARVAGPAAPR
jgi:glycosyltransferase involved in cell wall biosynthesis